MEKNIFYRKYIIPIIACCLAVIISLEIIINPFAKKASADEKILYISEVKLFQHDEYFKAIEACQNEGFTPFGNDLNEGTGEDSVILGYKTTENRSEAITDLSVLQMGNGYQYNTYAELLQAQRRQFDLLAEEIYSLLPEFRSNLDKGSPAAKYAYDLLNYFYYDEKEKPLGTVLLENCNPAAAAYEPEILPNLLQCGSAGLFNAIMSALIPAVADYNPDTPYQPGAYKVAVDSAPEIKVDMDAVIASLSADETTAVSLTDTTVSSEDTTVSSAETTETTVSAEQTTDTEETAELTAEQTDTTAQTEDSTAETAGSASEQTEETTDTTIPTDPAQPETTEAASLTTTASEMTASSESASASGDTFTGDPEFNPENDETTAQTTETSVTVAKKEIVLNCDMNYGNWALRIRRTGMAELYKEKKISDKEREVYESAAREIRQAVQDFAANYQNAAAREAKYQLESILPEVEADANLESTLAYISGNTVNGGSASDADAYYLSAYKILDQYMYDDETTVAEYIVNAGCAAYSDEKDAFYQLYPLAAALTNGQLHLMQVNGVAALVMYLENTKEIEKKLLRCSGRLKQD